MTSLKRARERGDTHRSWVVAALLLTATLTGCGDRPTPSCPSGTVIEVDLVAWREAIDAGARSAAETGGGERDRLLGQLALPPMPEGIAATPPGHDAGRGETRALVLPVRRGGGEPDDWLAALRYRGPGGAESLRAQLLRPVAGREHLYCVLGDDLSRDSDSFERPCLEPWQGPARELAVQPLVAPDRDAVLVSDAGGWCGPGTSRADRFATSLWGVEGDRLVLYLEVVTHESRYESPAPPSRLRRAEIAFSGGWPRTITVTEVIECHSLGEAVDADCQPSGSFTRYRYTDGSYVADGSHAAEEETDP